MRTIAVAALAATLLLGVQATTAVADDSREERFELSGKPTLHLETNDGKIQIQPWAEHAIRIRVTTHGWRIGGGGIEITKQREGDRISYTARVPRFEFDFGFMPRWVHIDVWAPSAADLEVRSGDGSVTLNGLTGAINVHTGDGRITADALKGDLVFDTSDGGIIGTGLDGSLDAHTGDGSVRVDGRFDGLKVSTGDGSVEVDAARGSKLTNGWNVTTGDGGVELRVPKDLRANLDAHTGDGHIELELPVQVVGHLSRRDLHGTLNGGGPTLTVRTGDGGIHLRTLDAR